MTTLAATPLETVEVTPLHPERFAELKSAWERWDAGMLHDPTAPSAGNSPANLADHFSAPPPPAAPSAAD